MPHRNRLKLNLIAALAAVSGIVTLSSTLAALAHLHRIGIVLTDAHLTVLAGLSLIYLATLLRRGKRNAWLISLPVYVYLILRNFQHFFVDFRVDEHYIAAALNLLLPLVTLGLLVVYRGSFTVRSETRSFTVALRRSALILLIALLYGIIGFSLMDEHDFYQEIGPATAAHYTIDQFNLTTSQQLTAHTKRARLFVDSLAAISAGALFYTAVSLFAPIRFRLLHSRSDHELARAITRRRALTSEDFFKLWPADKNYFFSPDRRGFIAYRVVGGVALAVGDPLGPTDSVSAVLANFLDYCWLNDWVPAFIHTERRWLKLYEKHGLSSQKIGEEALVDIRHFNQNVATNKYFRHIRNKFTKQGYSCEMLVPPHSEAVINRLKSITHDWLEVPGKTERGFMMGFFSEAYLQQCRLMVLRDGEGNIQTFLNQVPSFKTGEANFDFLRSSGQAPTNANDFLMINFFRQLGEQGIRRVNMGLSPLTGLGWDELADRTATDGLLHFVYDAADRFYSFQGLARFKSKYEPEWADRFVVYRGGFAGFSRTMNALLRAMRVK